ncbi:MULTISPECIES: archaetidylserine decarboxylase [unclassified Shewanella]|uniref:archaetidylserine decarboxylase n=1 Tax=unclassified Shewanella TaxID=196818 RepID=UPI0006D677E3|nr:MULTISPECIES: archaetidylserine decarboxylase [unclassified Shewanella]KPZ72154.1 Phosphatidylserine decarboxylase proenzyme [Shewanella sp. P1-14-1]OBT08249.1 phosphatidylserine decarboxylase [Shewanella sp. UCD-FRSSP16_17]
MDSVKIALQYILPKHLLSRLVGKLAAAEAGAITTAGIKWFIKQYKIDMSEAAESEPEAYKTFNAFFTRALKPGLRPIVADDKIIAHPVDGAVSQCGPIEAGKIVQAKNHDYTTLALLGGQQKDAERFTGGDFATIYLAPKDYHRIHMPMTGTLSKMTYIPGELFSVNPLTAQNVPGLFARNERVVAIFETEVGPLAMVLVGATIVASIETIWAGTVTPPCGKQVFTWDYPTEGPESLTLEKGAEMGRFKLGSTVVMLFGQDAIDTFAEGVEPTETTRMGQAFAHLK